MTLTTEQIQAILDGAPDGATHWDSNSEYWQLTYSDCLVYKPIRGILTWVYSSPVGLKWFSRLSDLREILKLRQEVEGLKIQHAEVIETSLDWLNLNYPNACQPACGLLQHYANKLRGERR